jgi:hypothetical protein
MSEPIRLTWALRTRASTPATWAVLSDTDRLNRLAGLGFEFSAPAADAPFSRATGRQKHLGLTLRWQERPVEFTEGEDLKIERLYENGPVSRVVNTLRLEPTPLGTEIHYQVDLWPRAALLRPVVYADVHLTVKPGLSRALAALIEALDSAPDAPDAPDAPAPALSSAAEKQLALRLRGLHDAELAAHLGEHLRHAPLTEQIRMRPLALARRWGHAPERVVLALLEAEAAGLLTLHWEVLCPSCRLGAPPERTLSFQRRAAHCGTCDLRWDASIADAIALIFRPVPEIRRTLGTPRCLSSPARTPQVLWQRNLPPGAEVAWSVVLPPGRYRLRTVPALDVVTFRVTPEATGRELVVLVGPQTVGPPVAHVAPGRVTLRLRSKLDHDATLVVERPFREADQLCVGDLLAWPEVAARLPADALEGGVEVAPFEGLALVVQVSRGGAEGERLVAEALREVGVRALQVSTGWVMATLPDAEALRETCAALQGAVWLTAAVGHGSVVELSSGGERIAAGPLMHALVALASEASPGAVVALAPERWPPHLAPPTLGLAPRGELSTSTELRNTASHGAPLLPPMLTARRLGPGAVVDARFELRDELGKGGFGVVFAAMDRKTGGDVVVKLLHDACAASPDAVQRFFDEGRLSARLQGPNVVRVHEWGLAEDGRLFIAMERLHGRELAEVLRDARTLSVGRTLRLTLDALAGLGEAHGQGLVHRDVKPANLFVVDEGLPTEHVKVIDFGIALDRTGEVRSVDRPGVLVGTPGYVSPEQVSGSPVDGRSDLYALGLVVHVCLAGSLPFVSETSLGLVFARMTTTPAALDTRCPAPLPPGLGRLVDAMLAREPADRPMSAAALAAVLRPMVPPPEA